MDLGNIIKNIENSRDRDILYSYYINGESIKWICKRYKVSDRYLYKIIKENNLEKRKTEGAKTRELIEANKELLYYLVGLISSDGYMYEVKPRIEIGLNLNDKDLLENLSYLIYGDNRVILQEVFSVNGRARLFIYGKEVVQLFKSYGITQRKSVTMDLRFETFEEEYIWHFIRGYFDGDGSYYTKAGRLEHNVTLKVDGNEKTIYGIKEICLKYGFHPSMFKINNTCCSFDFFRFQIAITDEAIRFIKYVYNDSTLFLQRKYDLIKHLI